MSNSLLMGIGRYLLPLPAFIWQRQVRQDAQASRSRLGFMSEDHRRIHHLVVRELPRLGKPMPPEWIAGQVGLPLPRVVEVLDELERHMTFIFRNPEGAAVWAYPVTVEQTPHCLRFTSGEQIYAA